MATATTAAALGHLAKDFGPSLKGRWRESAATVYANVMAALVDKSDNNMSSPALSLDPRLVRAAVLSIQVVRASPLARPKLLTDALCPKPYSTDLLLYMLVAALDCYCNDNDDDQEEEEEAINTTVFTGSKGTLPKNLSDTEAHICALALSQECTSRLDFADDAVWRSYLQLERRLHRLALITTTTTTTDHHHAAVVQRDTGHKGTVMLHSLAAISAAVWSRRRAHLLLAEAVDKEHIHHRHHHHHQRLDAVESGVRRLLEDSYRDWAGVRFRQAITKGRANSLGRAHDREVCGFLANGVTGAVSTLNESVETAFMPVPHVLKAVLGDFNSFQLPKDDGVLGDDAVVLYLANSVLKQRFGVPLLDSFVLTEANWAKSAPALAASRYRPPHLLCGPQRRWGVLHYFHNNSSSVEEEEEEEEDKGPCFARCSSCGCCVKALSLWIVLFAEHLLRDGGGGGGGTERDRDTSTVEFCNFVSGLGRS